MLIRGFSLKRCIVVLNGKRRRTCVDVKRNALSLFYCYIFICPIFFCVPPRGRNLKWHNGRHNTYSWRREEEVVEMIDPLVWDTTNGRRLPLFSSLLPIPPSIVSSLIISWNPPPPPLCLNLCPAVEPKNRQRRGKKEAGEKRREKNIYRGLIFKRKIICIASRQNFKKNFKYVINVDIANVTRRGRLRD